VLRTARTALETLKTGATALSALTQTVCTERSDVDGPLTLSGVYNELVGHQERKGGVLGNVGLRSAACAARPAQRGLTAIPYSVSC